MGEKARDSVRERFLLPRLALDYLKAAKSNLDVSDNGNGRGGKALRDLQVPDTVHSLSPNG